MPRARATLLVVNLLLRAVCSDPLPPFSFFVDGSHRRLGGRGCWADKNHLGKGHVRAPCQLDCDGPRGARSRDRPPPRSYPRRGQSRRCRRRRRRRRRRRQQQRRAGRGGGGHVTGPGRGLLSPRVGRRPGGPRGSALGPRECDQQRASRARDGGGAPFGGPRGRGVLPPSGANVPKHHPPHSHPFF